jgi:hypothetical protein
MPTDANRAVRRAFGNYRDKSQVLSIYIGFGAGDVISVFPSKQASIFILNSATLAP